MTPAGRDPRDIAVETGMEAANDYVPDGTIVTADLAASAVTAAKIAANAVTTVKIIDNAVTTAKIIDNAVTTPKIIDNAVTNAKLAGIAAGSIKGGDAAGDPADIDMSTDAFVLFGKGAGALPVAAAITGDVDVASTGASTIGANKVVTAHILDANVTSPKIALSVPVTGDFTQSPGVGFYYIINLPDVGGANPNDTTEIEITPNRKILVLDAHILKTDGANGANNNTVRLLNQANPITEALDMQTAGPAAASLVDNERVSFFTFDDAYTTIDPATDTLKLSVTKAGGNEGVRVVVLCVPVA